ncbi:hypothetical protein [Novosphingobium aquae]|uniref:Uncharacterized protein n=1 Tax=Novosphingobium aquae TaxID=3133435 RepID=A0ABU8SC82_9SPHN
MSERRLTAYADVLTALGAMQLILGRWADDMEGLRSYSDEAKVAFNDEYRSARQRIEQTVAVAELILPPESATLLNELRQSLEGDDGSDPFEAINVKYGVLDDAFGALIAQGRSQLS